MNYIVFDLEWNQCPYGKEREVHRLPFEIVEIGAVKVNEDMEIVDTCHILVKPTVYKKIHFRTREVISLTIEDLKRDGLYFPDAIKKFLKWCGDGIFFCTWGTHDLTEMQRNMAYYKMLSMLPGPIFFGDVQKYFALTYETRKDRRALSYAADYLDIEDNGEFHRALDDALYTAKVLQTIPEDIIWRNTSVDTYQNPRRKEDEIRIRYETYEKYVTREFPSKEKLLSSPEQKVLPCFVCGKPTEMLISPFSASGKNYVSVGDCPEHGHMKSKLRVKTAEDGKIFGVRTIRALDDDELALIDEKHHRDHKRHKV